jgi:hypothetical protein
MNIIENESEKRGARRSALTVTFDYSYSFVEAGRLNCTTSQGVTTNISGGGMCFYTIAGVSMGQEMKVFNETLFESPKTAFVRWCSKISESIFKIGLQFA